MTLELIISGGRKFNDYNLLESECDVFIEELKSIYGFEYVEIVTGGALGADTLGARYAKSRGYNIRVFKADWSIGKRAGVIRNNEMADYVSSFECGAVIAFWDGVSHGTANMIDTANRYDLRTKIVSY